MYGKDDYDINKDQEKGSSLLTILNPWTLNTKLNAQSLNAENCMGARQLSAAVPAQGQAGLRFRQNPLSPWRHGAIDPTLPLVFLIYIYISPLVLLMYMREPLWPLRQWSFFCLFKTEDDHGLRGQLFFPKNNLSVENSSLAIAPLPLPSYRCLCIIFLCKILKILY